MKNETFLTQQGYESIKKEHDELEAKRPQYVIELTRARDLGDRSENGAYKAARWRLSRTDSRLRFLKKILEHARISKPSQNDVVEIGSTVTVNNGTNEYIFHIVGDHEADPKHNKISYRSPIGQSLLGCTAGVSIAITTPSGSIIYKILSIK